MHSITMILASIVLMIPAGLSEHCARSSEGTAHAWYSSSSDELLTASEGEVEEPEFFFHWVPFFEHHAQPDSHLPLNGGCSVLCAAVDPLGRRPPPAA